MSQIDSFLVELASRLRTAPRVAQRLLSETEEHLHDAVETELAAGQSGADAESRALSRFGSAREVAKAANSDPVAVGGRALLAAAQLCVAGCLAVLSGAVLAKALAQVTSTSWVFGLPAGVTPRSDRISHWLQVQPGAQDWHQAAALENAADSLLFRGAVAALGLVVALVVLLAIHHRVGRPTAAVVPGIGAATFAVAALVLFLGGITGTFGLAEWGRGQWFSDAAVALFTAAAYGVRLRRDLRPT